MAMTTRRESTAREMMSSTLYLCLFLHFPLHFQLLLHLRLHSFLDLIQIRHQYHYLPAAAVDAEGSRS